MDTSSHGGPLSINTGIDGSMNSSQLGASMMSDGMSEPSSPEPTTFDESDLLQHTVHDDITAQLAAAGPIGVAAAAAIATGKRRKRQHTFETNPSVRKRQQTRLLRKLRTILEEYTTRVGQQAVILCCTPGKPNQAFQSYKVFGSQPLENVIRNCRGVIMQDLESALALQAPPQQPEDPGLHELPPLVLDGIPTPVDKMTQAQLRAFIPLMLKCSTGRGKPGWGKNSLKPVWWPSELPWANIRVDVRTEEDKQKALLRAFIPEMLKYSTGRSKPGWGKPECRPVWWPNDVPWANVRSDVRTEEEKKKLSWTHALRAIVKNCYKHHGREDLMPEFGEENNNAQQATAAATFNHPGGTVVQTINNPDGTVSIIQIDTGTPGGAVVTHGGTMVTLADGTQAHVVHAAGFSPLLNKLQLQPETPQHEATQAVQTLADVAATHNEVGHTIVGSNATPVEMNSEAAAQAVATLTEATLSQDGQLILTGDASLGTGDTATKYGIVTIPVSMYQTVASSIATLSEANQHQQVNNMQIAMATTNNSSNQNGHVPDATHAVEVMTVEQS